MSTFWKITKNLTFDTFKGIVPFNSRFYIFNKDNVITEIFTFDNDDIEYCINEHSTPYNGYSFEDFINHFNGLELMLESDFKRLPIFKIIKEIQDD